jgi:hypothetical protein
MLKLLKQIFLKNKIEENLIMTIAERLEIKKRRNFTSVANTS